MYYCWKTHHMPPSTYYNLPYGEKAVLIAFFLKEMEEIKEQNEAMEEANGSDGSVKKSAYVSDEDLAKMYGEKPS